MIYNQGMRDTDPSLKAPQPNIDLDDPAVRDQLRTMSREATQPGALFGRDFDFTPERRILALDVAEAARAKLQPHLDARQDEWDKFQALVKEGTDKGVLLSFTTHQGTFVPTWCIDGGPDAQVHKVRSDDGKAQIAIPSELFGLFDWMQTIDGVEQIAASSDELLKGSQAQQLGAPIGRLSHLLTPEN